MGAVSLIVRLQVGKEVASEATGKLANSSAKPTQTRKFDGLLSRVKSKGTVDSSVAAGIREQGLGNSVVLLVAADKVSNERCK